MIHDIERAKRVGCLLPTVANNWTRVSVEWARGRKIRVRHLPPCVNRTHTCHIAELADIPDGEENREYFENNEVELCLSQTA